MTDLPKQNLTPRARSEQLLKEVLGGKDVHSHFEEQMKDEILISGQPMSHWEDKFHLFIPTDDLNPARIRQLDKRLMELNEEAVFLLNTAMAKLQMIKYGNQSIFMKRFNELVNEYKGTGKRLPAKDTLENLARSGTLDIEAAQSIADIELKFWKQMLDHLGRCQSILKNSTLALSTELKYDALERNLDAMERNHGR